MVSGVTPSNPVPSFSELIWPCGECMKIPLLFQILKTQDSLLGSLCPNQFSQKFEFRLKNTIRLKYQFHSSSSSSSRKISSMVTNTSRVAQCVQHTGDRGGPRRERKMRKARQLWPCMEVSCSVLSPGFGIGRTPASRAPLGSATMPVAIKALFAQSHCPASWALPAGNLPLI